MTKYLIFQVFCGMLFFISGNAQKNPSANKSAKQKGPVQKKRAQKEINFNEIKWTGTISLVEIYKGLIGKSEMELTLSFNNALPTLHRNVETTDLNFTNDKGKGTIKNHEESSMTVKDDKTGIEEEKVLSVCDCTGEGKSELHEVVIDIENGNYSISAVGPLCDKGGNNEDGSCGGRSSDIIISERKLGSDPFLLSGNETIDRDISLGKVSTITTWNLRGCLPWNDPQTRIRNVRAAVKAAATRSIKRAHDELCLNLKVASGLRTNHEQGSLYTLGRTIRPPDKPVTYATAGNSFHNYGLAIDVYIVKNDGKLDLKARIPPEAIKIAKEEGFAWEGDWSKKKKDYPHFEMIVGQTIKQL